MLKFKLEELSRIEAEGGDTGKIAEEIAALREVMSNNGKIADDLAASLQRNKQERKLVQARMLELIAKGFKNSHGEQDDVYTQHLQKTLQLLTLGGRLQQNIAQNEQQDLHQEDEVEPPSVVVVEQIEEKDVLEQVELQSERQILQVNETNTLPIASSPRKDAKVEELEKELEVMKRKLAEKVLLCLFYLLAHHYILGTPTGSEPRNHKEPHKQSTLSTRTVQYNPSKVRSNQ